MKELLDTLAKTADAKVKLRIIMKYLELKERHLHRMMLPLVQTIDRHPSGVMELIPKGAFFEHSERILRFLSAADVLAPYDLDDSFVGVGYPTHNLRNHKVHFRKVKR